MTYLEPRYMTAPGLLGYRTQGGAAGTKGAVNTKGGKETGASEAADTQIFEPSTLHK